MPPRAVTDSDDAAVAMKRRRVRNPGRVLGMGTPLLDSRATLPADSDRDSKVMRQADDSEMSYDVREHDGCFGHDHAERKGVAGSDPAPLGLIPTETVAINECDDWHALASLARTASSIARILR